MRLSLITVCYNSIDTIQDTLDSIRGQSLEDFEYIIVDGKSTDGTLEVLEMNTDIIDKLISECDDGIYDAMNKGLANATGDVIGFLNSDDIYEDSSVLSDVMSAFMGSSSPDIIYGNIVYVSRFDNTRIVRRWISGVYRFNYFELAYVPAHPSLFVKRQVYSEAGGFDTTFKIAADYEFMLRIFKKFNYEVIYMDRLMVRMRIGGASNSSLKGLLQQNIEVMESWRMNDFRIPWYFYVLRLYRRIAQFVRRN